MIKISVLKKKKKVITSIKSQKLKIKSRKWCTSEDYERRWDFHQKNQKIKNLLKAKCLTQ